MHQKKITNDDILKIIDSIGDWKNFFSKTVLITGANGYVPSYFVHTFLALNDKQNANIKVIALCRNKEKAYTKFEEYLGRNDFVILIQDVCDPIEIDCDVHFFIHAASPAGIVSRHTNPVETFNSNILGCDNLLRLAAKKSCEKFLFVSSVDVYGKMNSAERLKETDCGTLDSLNIRNVYSIAKKATETLCLAYHKQYNLPVVIVRPFQILGPGLELNDGRLHIDFISQMLQGNKIILKSDGKAKRTFMYITDAISAMLTAWIKGNEGECYNIVDENGEATVLELAQLMASCVADRTVTVEFDYSTRNNIEVTSALSIVTGCSDKIKSLGYTASLTLKEGAERMMQHYGLKTENGGNKDV